MRVRLGQRDEDGVLACNSAGDFGYLGRIDLHGYSGGKSWLATCDEHEIAGGREADKAARGSAIRGLRHRIKAAMLYHAELFQIAGDARLRGGKTGRLKELGKVLLSANTPRPDQSEDFPLPSTTFA